ncbi:MAG: peptide deformylase [Candidatus Kapaibacteriota bacterium]
MILPIYTYNHPVLKQRTADVDDLTDDVRDLINNMIHTMRVANGIGLAANQVGKGLSLTVIDLAEDGTPADDDNALVLINPVVEAVSDHVEEFEEGCLSLPDYRDIVVRPEAIQVRYTDAALKECVREVDGLLARVMQHEIDHLNGIYFFERLSPIRRTLGSGKLKRIARGDVDADYELFQP